MLAQLYKFSDHSTFSTSNPFFLAIFLKLNFEILKIISMNDLLLGFSMMLKL